MFLEGYRMQWEMTNGQGTSCDVRIYKRSSGAGTTVFTDLQPSEDAFHLFVINNDEEKFKSPIRALQAEFKFESDETTNLSSFVTNEDNEWLVEAFVDGSMVFTGYLVTEDMQEDFQDLEAGNTVTLTATDNLGLLKDEPLTTDANTNPRGHYSLIQLVAMCLEKTQLGLPINVRHNLKFEHDATKVMYQAGFLEAKTFEEDINLSEDSYTVLEKILNHDAFLTQSGGEWWIIAINEMYGYGNTVTHRFEANGDFQETLAPVAVPEKAFGYDQIMQFSEMAAYNIITAPVNAAQFEYPYQYPREIVDNIDFDRGDENVGLSTGGYTAYDIDDWDLMYSPVGITLLPATSTQGWAFIKRIFFDGYEKERYGVLRQNASVQLQLQSQRIPLGLGDKFYCGIDVKYLSNISSSGTTTARIMQIRLYGDDGTYWTLEGGGTVQYASSFWQQSNAGFTINLNHCNAQWNTNNTNETEWHTYSWEAAPLPVAGDIEVHIVHAGGTLGTEMHFFNLQFNYMPLINGSYQKYRAQETKVAQSLNTKRVYGETVSVSDSPRPLFKGALKIFNGTKYVLAGRVFDGLQHVTVPPDTGENLNPYRVIQAYQVWQQVFRPFRIFDFEAQDLDGVPDLTYRYTITDISDHSNGAQFMLLHFDIDFMLGTIKGVLAEIARADIDRDYASPVTFKYLSDRP